MGIKSTRPELNLEEVGEIIIPIPPREIQDKIASMMNGAYKAKKEKEAEANEILSSIEPYLSEQLGISQEKFQTETPQVFSVTSDIVKGKHLSPFYYLLKSRKAWF